MGLTTDNQLKQAVQLARQGNATGSLTLLRQITRQDPNNLPAWMWLAYVTPDNQQKRSALRRALALSPESQQIRTTIQRLATPKHVQSAAHNGVFMGYARADEIFAIDLNDSLRANGIATWMDMTEIDTETTWHHSIARALRDCGVMVMILSPAAIQSDDLSRERDWFLQTGKIVVPVVRQTCDYHGLNLLCTPVDFRADYAAGVQALVNLLTVPDTAQVL